MTSNLQLTDRDLSGSLHEHWKKGIPTLILLVLAVLISGYYGCSVRPGIQAHYSNLVRSNLALLGMSPLDNGESRLAVPPPSKDMPTSKRLELLKETQLCFRRLIGWNPKDDSIHYQYGILSGELSNRYLDEAIRNQKEEGQNAIASQYFAQAKNERQTAMDALSRVRKLNGPMSDKASLWIMKRQLDENVGLPIGELSLIEQSMRALLTKESVASEAKWILGQVLVELSLRCSSDLSLPRRGELLKEAITLLQSQATQNLSELTLQAEARDTQDSAAGQQLANQALQVFWGARDSQPMSVESLAAVFRCFLMINSVKEGQAFLSEQLQQVSPLDQPKFRALTAAAALRHVVANAIQFSEGPALTSRVGIAAPVGLDNVLSLAAQLDPESNELLALLEKFAKPTDDDAIVTWLKSELGFEPPRNTAIDVGLKSFLTAVVGLSDGNFSDAAAQTLGVAVKASPAYAVAGSRLAVKMALAETMSPVVAIQWLRAINAAAPEVLVAWSDRANLHMKFDQAAQAIQCYEFLLEKLPDNDQIKDALKTARMKL